MANGSASTDSNSAALACWLEEKHGGQSRRQTPEQQEHRLKLERQSPPEVGHNRSREIDRQEESGKCNSKGLPGAGGKSKTSGSSCEGKWLEDGDAGKQNRGNNSNYNATRTTSSSYSKIFRQYLPSSLNLSYALNSSTPGHSSPAAFHNGSSSSSSNNNNNNKSNNNDTAALAAEAEANNKSHRGKCKTASKQLVTSAGLEPEKLEAASELGAWRPTREPAELETSGSVVGVAHQSTGRISNSIANALSRFRITSPSSGSGAKSNRLKRSSQEEEADRGQVAARSARRNNNNNQHSDSSQLIEAANSSSANIISGWLEPKSSVVRRTGFLYLKRTLAASSPAERAQEAAELRAGHRSPQGTGTGTVGANSLAQATSGTARHFLQSGKRTRDVNNNSLSAFLATGSANNHLRNDEHRTSLLEAHEEAQREEENETLLEDEQLLIREGKKKLLTAPQMAGHRKASPAGNTIRNKSKSQLEEMNMSANMMGGQPSRGLLAGGTLVGLISVCLLGILCVLLAATSAIGQVSAQQQQPQPHSQLAPPAPFTRSQPSSASAASLAPSQQLATSGRPTTPQPAAGSLVASINCNKIRGHVTLTPNMRGPGTTVSTQISSGPAGEVYQWSVHQFPVKPGAAMCSCSPLILGTKLIDLSEMHGNLPSDQEFNVQSSLNLFGAESPVGHSLMLRGMKTGMVACATFLPTSRKSNYRAKFHTPLSGSVTIFQTAFGTSFISHLMYSNGTRRHSQHRFDLVRRDDDIITTSLLSGAQVSSSLPLTSGGSLNPGQQRGNVALTLELQREHENEITQCRRFTQGETPLFRNMSYQLAVSTENFGMRGRTSLVLPPIPFETFSTVYLVVYSEYDPSEPIACAPLKFVKPKTAAAKFQSVSVQGSVVFSQDSPYDVTVARINLNMPNSDGHSYGIDELPMIIRRKSDTRVCPNIREIIYNPHHVEPSSVPSEGEATSDQYAVGDLSGKYGSLTGKSSEKIQVNDYNLPLFGPISIVGRAMTIYSAEGVAIACSNVELTTPMTTAFATFDYGIQGQFIFRQPLNDCNGDTYVYIEVSKPVQAGQQQQQSLASSGSSSAHQHGDIFRSLDHNWHIHVDPVDSGLDHLSTTDCAPAGPHYNPYNTSTSSIYTRDCTPFNVLRCELGDLSAKMFTIDIPPYRIKGGQEPDIGKFFGTDIDLPLCGPVSVVNRSVVVHVQDFGTQRLACSTVIEFKPRTS